MQYSLFSHESLFKKKFNQHQLQQNTSRLLFILPLAHRQVVLFYDDFNLFHVKISTLNILHHIQLPGRVYDAISINNDIIVLLMVQKKNIIEVNLKQGSIQQIFKMSSDSLYNSKREASNFFLSKLRVFNESQSFYLQQDLTDQRKVKIIFFPHAQQMQLQKRTQQIIQFQSRNHVTVKLDQRSKVVKFKQNPQENGRFFFQQIDLQTDLTRQIRFQNPSFILYSTVIDIKKLDQDRYIISLNTKNGQHQLVIFGNDSKSRTLLTSEKIIKQCIGINRSLNVGIFSFIYGKTMYSECIRVIDLDSFMVVDQVQLEIDRVVFSRDQMYFVEYTRQSRLTKQSQFRTFYLANKNVEILKMLQNLKVEQIFGQEFCSEITSMLN